MKKRIHIIRLVTLAAAFALLSCTKDTAAPERLYPFSVTAGMSTHVDTRAVLGPGGFYYWSPGDEIGLCMTPAGVGSPIANNVLMTGNMTSEVLTATFTGTFTRTQINAISPGQKYDYYSYFPYRSDAGGFPIVQFAIPSTIVLAPNRFTSAYAPMVAIPLTGREPIIHPPANEQTISDPVHFRYRHVLSYLALSLEGGSGAETVAQIEITCDDASTYISGRLHVDLRNGMTGWSSGVSGTLTVDIDGGAGPGDVLYIPMIPGDMTGKTISLRFTTTGGGHAEVGGIPCGRLERGAIHILRQPLPVNYVPE